MEHLTKYQAAFAFLHLGGTAVMAITVKTIFRQEK